VNTVGVGLGTTDHALGGRFLDRSAFDCAPPNVVVAAEERAGAEQTAEGAIVECSKRFREWSGHAGRSRAPFLGSAPFLEAALRRPNRTSGKAFRLETWSGIGIITKNMNKQCEVDEARGTELLGAYDGARAPNRLMTEDFRRVASRARRDAEEEQRSTAT
jgi:hypothetical protein